MELDAALQPVSPRTRAARAALRVPEYGKSGIHDLTRDPMRSGPGADPVDFGLAFDNLPPPGYGMPGTLSIEATTRAWLAVRARQEERADFWSVRELDKIEREAKVGAHSGGWLRDRLIEIDARWKWPNKPVHRVLQDMQEEPFEEMQMLYEYHGSPYVVRQNKILYDSGARAPKRPKAVMAPDLDSAPSTPTHESSDEDEEEEDEEPEDEEKDELQGSMLSVYRDTIVVPSSHPSNASSPVFPTRARAPNPAAALRVPETPDVRVYVPSSPPRPPMPPAPPRRRDPRVIPATQ